MNAGLTTQLPKNKSALLSTCLVAAVESNTRIALHWAGNVGAAPKNRGPCCKPTMLLAALNWLETNQHAQSDTDLDSSHHHHHRIFASSHLVGA